MAITVDDYKFKAGRGRSFYDWDEWTNGKVWQIEQGEDFDCATASMQTNIHKAAAVRNLTARTNITSPTTIVFQFVHTDEPTDDAIDF